MYQHMREARSHSAAVGQLQFEVVQFRLQNEYGETQLELPHTLLVVTGG